MAEKDKSDKALFKYDELLKVEVKGPIENVEVPVVHKELKFDSIEKVNTKIKNLKKDLAEGEALELAPLVIGKVIIYD